jgi:tetratricopeptide (TPR) repeat protein
VRSFNQALRFDPKLAMAYVGLSRGYSGLDDQLAARAALEKAQGLEINISQSERRRICVRAKQLEALADLGNVIKHLEYKKVIDDALAIDINDAELWLLRGNAEEPTAAGRGQRGGAASVAFYERVLAISPDNFAAHHYLIHSYETMGHIEEALNHGEAYLRLAFSIPHAHHMYGHDLRRVGRIEEAIAQFRAADELENAYYKTNNIPANYDWHHQHNLDLLSTSYQYQGKMQTAEQLMRQAFAIPSVDAGREYQKKEWPRFLLGRARTAEALDAANVLKKSKWPATRTIGHIIASQALLVMNQMVAAREELAGAERDLRDVPRSAGGVLVSQSAVEPEVEALRAEILLRSGEIAKGRTIMKGVESKLRALLGPDAWSMTLFRLEFIARIAREVGDWELAEYTAQQMLEHDPSYAGTHYALALVAEHKGDTSTTQQEFATSEKYWSHADPDLPELLDARVKGSLRK